MSTTGKMRSFLATVAAAGCLLAEDFHCTFAPDAWRTEDWVLVKSPRWPHRGEWIQERDCLRNRTPTDATQAEMLGKRAGETYTSMLLREPVEGNMELAATMSFEHRMAPLIVLAAAVGEDQEGHPEHREHWEIVLFDEGVNVWHHMYADGKPSWRRVAHARFPVEPGKPHRLEVMVRRTPRGAQISVRVGEHEFGYLDTVLPPTVQVGITGCEGVNRFYGFELKRTR